MSKKGEDGWYGKYSEYGAAKLYEDLYCGRAADCELNIAEFKTDCFGGRASSTRFCTNGYRMILGMVTLLVLKLARHYLFGVVKESAKKAGSSCIVVGKKIKQLHWKAVV